MASLFQEVILAADIRCAKCQEKVANTISRVDIDVESMEVDVLAKKVIITCKSVSEGSSRPADITYNNLSRKASATARFPSMVYIKSMLFTS